MFAGAVAAMGTGGDSTGSDTRSAVGATPMDFPFAGVPKLLVTIAATISAMAAPSAVPIFRPVPRPFTPL